MTTRCTVTGKVCDGRTNRFSATKRHYMSMIRKAYSEQTDGRRHDGVVEVDIYAYVTRDDKAKRRRDKMPHGRPETAGIASLVVDALAGIAYNTKDVCSVSCMKFFAADGAPERLEITVRNWKEAST